jgi:DNA polymerase III alpha subunit (gram-positive type)
MILFSFDFETTGIDKQHDHVIEFGGILYSTAQKKCLDNQGMLVKTDREITPEITQITGITRAALDRFGYDSEQVLDILIEMISNADAMIGYNIRRFDIPVLGSWLTRFNKQVAEIPNIDLFGDLPWTVPLGKLSHLAADHGILNLFPHSAMSDAQTVLAIAEKYDSAVLVKRAASPVVILRSHQGRGDNDAVKQAPFRFRWNPERKIWWKPVKEQDVEDVIKRAPFQISIDKTLTQEELDN